MPKKLFDILIAHVPLVYFVEVKDTVNAPSFSKERIAEK